MESVIDSIRKRLQDEAAKIKNARDIEAFKRIFLGRKGELSAFADKLKSYGVEERRKYGAALNELRSEINQTVERLRDAFAETVQEVRSRFDVTRPGVKRTVGHLHPLTRVRREIERIFLSMGFSVVEGPEVETEWYNFDALNMPRFHPARDMQDTFWIFDPESQKSKVKSGKTEGFIAGAPSRRREGDGQKSRLLLRTQTSPMQVRYMEAHEPPLRIIVPGRVFRYEASDASHDIQFYQVEGLMVDKTISVANFKAVIQAFLRQLFREDTKIRLRPGYFPFVEPGFEIDASCPKCRQAGCRLCKQSGWIELMGAGMVHQNVFVNAGYQRNDWTGFAFGVGLDRLAIIKYGIDDIRLLYGGDIRFLRQF
jgi:phenylalanyl-tRNA synthetase alpha chain